MLESRSSGWQPLSNRRTHLALYLKPNLPVFTTTCRYWTATTTFDQGNGHVSWLIHHPCVTTAYASLRRRYDALLKAYEQLAELVIHTIRVEMRCRIVHFLDLAMRKVRGLRKGRIYQTVSAREAVSDSVMPVTGRHPNRPPPAHAVQ